MMVFFLVADEHKFANNDIQLDLIYRYSSNHTRIDNTNNFLKSKISLVGVGLKPSFNILNTLIIDLKGTFLKSIKERDYCYVNPVWRDSHYNGFRGQAYGELMLIFDPFSCLRFLPGVGYYYEFIKEGAMEDSNMRSQADIYGAYPVISLWIKLASFMDFRTYQSYVFASAKHKDKLGGEVELKTSYQDRIYKSLYELFFTFYKHWNIGLGYAFEYYKYRDGNLSEITRLYDQEARLSVKYDF